MFDLFVESAYFLSVIIMPMSVGYRTEILHPKSNPNCGLWSLKAGNQMPVRSFT
jgi:hypothetical protein